MPKTRNIYKEGTKIKSMCRICLTQSNTIMFKLTDQLKGSTVSAETYLEALEKITFSRVDLNGHYPEGICPMCVSFLKIALDFVSQFEMSQKKLQKMFKSNIPTYESIKLEYNSNDEEEDYITEEIKYDPDDPSNVELIIKDKKFNLNEVLVVEKHEKENHDYKGFLKKLGKEISTTTVTRNKKSKEKSFTANNSISNFENCEENEDTYNEYDANETEGEEENIEFIIEPPDDISTKIKDIKEEVEIEDNFNESNSQNNYKMDNIQFLEIDMFDKDTIESLIIDRTQLPDDEKESFDAPPRRKRRKKEEVKDEFLKEIKFPCEICKNVYQTRHSLNGHIRRAHNTFYNEQSFNCEICGVVCRTRSAFVNHKLKHFDKQFKCELCNKAYTTKAHLKVHVSTHMNIRPYLCNVCGKDFNYSNALTYHMRLHTGEKNYYCEYCPKRFRMINSLNRHVRTHTGEKPYKCQYCGRDFSSRGEVVCHEYIHTGYRPYHCKHCKKGFSKTHNLKIHLLSHGGPYHCQFCNKTFIEENILAMHHKISHKDLMTEEQTQECTEEDSQDSQEGAVSSFGDYNSQDENSQIELVEENSDVDYVVEAEVQMEDNSE